MLKICFQVSSCYWQRFKCWPVEASEIKFDIFMWLLLSNQPTQNSIHSEDKSPRCLLRKWPNIFTRCCLIFIQKQTILQILEKCYIWWSYFEPIVFYWCFEWRVPQSHYSSIQSQIDKLAKNGLSTFSIFWTTKIKHLILRSWFATNEQYLSNMAQIWILDFLI